MGQKPCAAEVRQQISNMRLTLQVHLQVEMQGVTDTYGAAE